MILSYINMIINIYCLILIASFNSLYKNWVISIISIIYNVSLSIILLTILKG